MKTDDNYYEANDDSTLALTGPVLINVVVDNGDKTATAVFTLYIYPDCEEETISPPVGGQTMADYTIYDPTYSYTFNDFVLSRSFCLVSSYEVTYDQDAGDFVTFNPATR